MTNHKIEIEPARSLSPDEDTSPDSSLAAAQFEAIIRAWKGETVGQTIPASPVGEVDWDGCLSLGQLDIMACNVSFDEYSWFCSPGESQNCSYACSLECTLNCSWAACGSFGC